MREGSEALTEHSSFAHPIIGRLPPQDFFSFGCGLFIAVSEEFDFSNKRMVDSRGLTPPKNKGLELG